MTISQTKGTLTKGRTDGTAVPAGYVGEKITWTTPPVNRLAIGPNVTDYWSNAEITLTPGVWLIQSLIETVVHSNTTNNTYAYIRIWITDGGSSGENIISSMANTCFLQNPTGDASIDMTYPLHFSGYVNISTTTTYKIRFTTADISGTSYDLYNDGKDLSHFFAVRIA